jgi:branched-chain amino acid transport system ATP-binding protein
MIFANLTMRGLMGAYLQRDTAAIHGNATMFSVFPRLQEREKQQAGTLSGGEQQILAVRRARWSAEIPDAG